MALQMNPEKELPHSQIGFFLLFLDPHDTINISEPDPVAYYNSSGRRRALLAETTGRGGYNKNPNGRGGYNEDPTGRGGYN
ncbi:hypothetical protein NC651_013957 [Populus alba x Populus x berolinensis]|nr:hypothetical protein NC651_013957 [Populus alba x Populus x berolinensis]